MVDDRRPVLVGVATVVQRPVAGSVPEWGAIELMSRALGAALDDAGRGAGELLDAIVVPRGAWQHPDPGRAIGRRIGCPTAASVVAEIGVLQQTLLTWACEAVAAGDRRAVAVVGGEAVARRRAAAIGGVELPGEPDADGEPDVVMAPAAEIITAMEVERDLAVPVHQYALIESVLAHEAGRTPRQQERRVAELWASASAVAATNPDAWHRDAWSAPQLAAGDRGNRMLSTPYRRWCVSDWTVDQASALVVVSAHHARRLGIAEQRFVWPVAAAESNHMVPLPQRRLLARSPAWQLAGQSLAVAGARPADADLIELYSCFPSAVQLAAAELGVPLDDRPWTVTGGMTFAGGPLNNYQLMATATMARRLRQRPGSTGLVTCVSGLLTKVAAAAWRSAGEPLPFVSSDVSAAAADATPTSPVRADLAGPATVVAATVVHERGVPARAVAIVESPAGERCVARSADDAVVARWLDDDVIGTVVALDGSGWFTTA
jgi:acetyl-CoA C-acetyltransferase